MDSPSTLDSIHKLLEKYSDVEKEGRINKYNEEMTKKDFILPLFDALGWKTTDSREVSAEEKVSKKRVDYGFRINGIPKFFLEAKSLKEDLDNPKYFEQAVSYAWHKGCTWAILTNFKRVKILNAEWKARNYLQSHFMTFEYWEFTKKIEDLLLLSKGSFEEGKLDKLAERYGKKTKKESVDQQLLNDFTRFREILSRNITKLNADKSLTEEELDESVQRILDRLIFIRNCEDRELEPKNLISNYRQWTMRGKGKLVKSLRDDFAYFDKQYNSKLFAEHLCDSLEIDNDVLEEVIVGLYYTKDRAISYDFSIIDADVLGTIYEQYLGYVLKKTEKRAKVTKSRIHRKEQGIYYTPTYIVDFIVRSTLGELLKNKKTIVDKIRVLDPACGSGSFLIKAFDALNEYYVKEGDHEQTQLDLETGIPFTVKVQILQNNIFGVDLDRQAVEIAQLNLLLKIAEKGHRLPLLEQNIKTGNSLIDNEAIAGSKAFKWDNEYEDIIMDGGFDIIIGNPPYYNIKSDSELKESNDYTMLSNGVVNISALFVKRSIDLLKSNGYLGFIIPKSFAYVDSWRPLRDFLFNNVQLVKVVDVSKAFKDVLLEQVIVIVKKQRPKPKNQVEIISDFNLSSQTINKVEHGELSRNNTISFSSNIFEETVFQKTNKDTIPLGKISENFRGIGAQKFVSIHVSGRDERILSGKEIQRYFTTKYHDYFISKEKAKLFKKSDKLRQPKIMCQNIVAHIRNHIKITATYDETGILNLDTVNNIVLTNNRFLPKYILAILNSKLISYYTYNFIYSKAIRTMHFDSNYSGKIPIKDIPIENQRAFEEIVDKLLLLNSRREDIGFKKTDEARKIVNDVSKLESDLDAKVFELYGFDGKEIATIEKSFE